MFIQTRDIQSESQPKARYKNIRASIVLINTYIPKLYTKKPQKNDKITF